MKNKLAQLVSLVFVVDYPTVWPTFYTDMMQFAKLGGQEATDLYLRILKAIDVEVVDREVLHTVEVRQMISFKVTSNDKTHTKPKLRDQIN